MEHTLKAKRVGGPLGELHEATHEAVVAILSRVRFPLDNEKRLQAAIEQEVRSRGFAFLREHPLFDAPLPLEQRQPLGIIDFLVPPGVGIEVKIKGTAKDLYRQLARYAVSAEIGCLVLVTAKATALPPLINGKPISIVDLGRAWL